MTAAKRRDAGLDPLLEALCGTIILAPGYAWHEVPDWIRDQVRLERLVAASAPQWHVATEAEALAYLCTLSPNNKFPHDAAQVYLYLATKYLRREGKVVPEEIAVETLTTDQKRLLTKLRWDIRRDQRRAWTQRRRNPSFAPAPEPPKASEGPPPGDGEAGPPSPVANPKKRTAAE